MQSVRPFHHFTVHAYSTLRNVRTRRITIRVYIPRPNAPTVRLQPQPGAPPRVKRINISKP